MPGGKIQKHEGVRPGFQNVGWKSCPNKTSETSENYFQYWPYPSPQSPTRVRIRWTDRGHFLKNGQIRISPLQGRLSKPRTTTGGGGVGGTARRPWVAPGLPRDVLGARGPRPEGPPSRPSLLDSFGVPVRPSLYPYSMSLILGGRLSPPPPLSPGGEANKEPGPSCVLLTSPPPNNAPGSPAE